MATKIDLASRLLVGGAMADHMEGALACDAMRMTLAGLRLGLLSIPRQPVHCLEVSVGQSGNAI